MTEIYVLLMLFGTSWRDGGLTTIQQEFESRVTCEAAYNQMRKNTTDIVFQNGGCFKKKAGLITN